MLEDSITNPTDQIEQVGHHNASPKDKTPPENDPAPETPRPPKRKLNHERYCLSSLLYPPKLHTNSSLLQFDMSISYQYFRTTVYLRKRNSILFICIRQTLPPFSMIKPKLFLHQSLRKSFLHTNLTRQWSNKTFLFNSVLEKIDKKRPFSSLICTKSSHHMSYSKFLQHTKPLNYIFDNNKYISPFTMTHLHTLDHSKVTGLLQTKLLSSSS